MCIRDRPSTGPLRDITPELCGTYELKLNIHNQWSHLGNTLWHLPLRWWIRGKVDAVPLHLGWYDGRMGQVIIRHLFCVVNKWPGRPFF